MNILITGGSGNLGIVLVRLLRESVAAKMMPRISPKFVCFDVKSPSYPLDYDVKYIRGSITDFEGLDSAMKAESIQTVVHLAGWHGIHESSKTEKDFEELNVQGTAKVLEAADRNKAKVVFLSSTSIGGLGVYGRAKSANEALIQNNYATTMKVVSLRAGAFIPYWDNHIYSSFSGWAKWFWRNGIHIDDVAKIVLASINALEHQTECGHTVLYATRGRDFELSDEDLKEWETNGPGNTFAKKYPEYYKAAITLGIDVTKPPKYYDINPLIEFTGFKPEYGLVNLFAEAKCREEGNSPTQPGQNATILKEAQ